MFACLHSGGTPVPLKLIVSDRRAGCDVDVEGKGVSPDSFVHRVNAYACKRSEMLSQCELHKHLLRGARIEWAC